MICPNCHIDFIQRRWNQKYCTDACQRQGYTRDYLRRVPCPECGAAKLPKAARCKPCADKAKSSYQADGERRDTITRLWNEGAPAEEIAAVVGMKPLSLIATVATLRRKGLDLPYRRKPRNARGADLRVPRAQDAVKQALRTGRLVRPSECSGCRTPGRPEAHHPDYDKPFEVVWLCRPCHTAHHVEERAAACCPTIVEAEKEAA